MKTSKIIAFLSVWNESEGIKEIIGEIYPWVDHVVIVDGRYKDFNVFPKSMESFRSDDSLSITHDVAKGLDIDPYAIQYDWNSQKQLMRHRCHEYKLNDYNITIITPVHRPWDTEMAKRSVMFHYGEEGDWFLIIDGDERVRHADWTGLRYHLDMLVPNILIAGVPLYDHKTGLKWHSPRLVRCIPGACYDQNHYTLKLNTRYHEPYYYDMVNDGSRRHDISEQRQYLAFDHLDRKELDPERWKIRVEYYNSYMARTENHTPYNVGKDRYHRQMDRWTMEPINRETQRKVLEQLERERK